MVLTQKEIMGILANLRGSHHLAACLLYGSGLRLMEAMWLRYHDIDTERLTVNVISGKDNKSRITTLAPALVSAIETQRAHVKQLLTKDLSDEQFAGVWLPDALERKYRSAGKALGWQYLAAVFGANAHRAIIQSMALGEHQAVGGIVLIGCCSKKTDVPDKPRR